MVGVQQAAREGVAQLRRCTTCRRHIGKCQASAFTGGEQERDVKGKTCSCLGSGWERVLHGVSITR